LGRDYFSLDLHFHYRNSGSTHKERDKVNKFAAVIILTIAFGLLGILALSSTSYSSVSDILKMDKPNRVVVMGNVTKGSVHYNKTLEFRINDGIEEVRVIYSGYVRLDNVSGYGTVVVRGIYYPENRTIVANSVESKCPSKQ